ncbi:MAG: hypothetical protein H7A18_10410 [Sinobacteraceae bacterium]|nr:hypothetical protein [Nevskiaceae bacterium]
MANAKQRGQGVIFRRYIRRKDGTLDDAHKHGLKAWPIRVGRNPRK